MPGAKLYTSLMKRWLRRSQLARTQRVQRSGAGYTIIEVLVVLVVTTLMFTAIVLVFNGRQNRVEFSQSVRNYEITLQNLIDEVSNGVYDSPFACTVNATGPSVNNGIPAATGSKDQCIFLGRMILPTRSLASLSFSDQDTIVSIIGRRMNAATPPEPVSNLTEAMISRDQFVDVVKTRASQLRVTRIVRQSDMTTNVAAIGFLYRLEGGSGVSSRLIELYGIPNTSVPITNVANTMNRNPSPQDLDDLTPLTDGVLICLTGFTGQRAQVRLGGSGSSTTTITSVLDTGSCP